MSKFNPGDEVVLVNADSYSDIMKQLVGKALVVRSVGNDKCGCEIVCAGISGEEGWFLRSDDLRLVSTEKPAPTSADFKLGDYVVPLRIDNNLYTEDRLLMQGKVLRVSSIVHDNFLNVRVGSLSIEAGPFWWNKKDLRHATPEEIAAAESEPKPKPLRRGDLVRYREQIGIVHNIDLDGYWVAALTGDGCCVHKNDKDLMRIGSIRKKLKRIKKEMEGGK